MAKFFTIVVPVYNPTRLDKALDSIQSQPNLEDIEVIIVNDAGSRDFESLLPNYSFEYKLITNEKNLGQGLARQVGVDNSTGEWITFLDHDDEFNPTCFKAVKDDIIASECIFVYSTQTLIANNYSFAEKQDFVVDDCPSVLHGHFYNRKMLEHYGIRFHEKIRGHEDTYFLNCVEGHIILDPKTDEEKTRVCSPLVTYYWYLWKESTSHSYVEGTKISYLENTIHDYITAVYDAYKHSISMHEAPMEFKMLKLCGTLICLYWFEQSFKYISPDGYKKENENYIREFFKTCMDEFGIPTVSAMTNLLLDLPDLFVMCYKSILSNVDGSFVPRETIEQFYQNLFEKKEVNTNENFR